MLVSLVTTKIGVMFFKNLSIVYRIVHLYHSGILYLKDYISQCATEMNTFILVASLFKTPKFMGIPMY